MDQNLNVTKERESNKDFYLSMRCKFNDIQSLNKWTNTLMEAELKRVAQGYITIEEARREIAGILNIEAIYRKRIFNQKEP